MCRGLCTWCYKAWWMRVHRNRIRSRMKDSPLYAARMRSKRLRQQAKWRERKELGLVGLDPPLPTIPEPPVAGTWRGVPAKQERASQERSDEGISWAILRRRRAQTGASDGPEEGGNEKGPEGDSGPGEGRDGG